MAEIKSTNTKLGSHQALSQVVAIHGSNVSTIPWRNKVNRTKKYPVTGLIFNYRGKEYIVTRRKYVISCTVFTMYQCAFDDKHTIFSQKLSVLFASADFDVIVFGSENREYFDPAASYVIQGDTECKVPQYSFDLVASGDHYQVPTKKTNYKVLNHMFDTSAPGMDYKHNLLDLKYMNYEFVSASNSPIQLMYVFMINSATNKSTNAKSGIKNEYIGLYGAPVFDKHQKLYGIIVNISNHKIYVLPTKSLFKILFDFVDNKMYPEAYKGIADIPIYYDITSDKVIVSDVHKIEVKGNTTNPKPRPFVIGIGDVLNKINDLDISVESNVALVQDPSLKCKVPIELYICLNYSVGEKIKLEFDRNGLIYNVFITCVKAVPANGLEITSQPYYKPTTYIPFRVDDNKVYVTLTYEILELAKELSLINKNNSLREFSKASTFYDLEKDFVIDSFI